LDFGTQQARLEGRLQGNRRKSRKFQHIFLCLVVLRLSFARTVASSEKKIAKKTGQKQKIHPLAVKKRSCSQKAVL
jgi:hypothetical protein